MCALVPCWWRFRCGHFSGRQDQAHFRLGAKLLGPARCIPETFLSPMSSASQQPLKIGAQAALCVGALGVVFGDIGTSPLYALSACLDNLPPVERTEGILGALSLIFWAMTF